MKQETFTDIEYSYRKKKTKRKENAMHKQTGTPGGIDGR